MFGDAIGIAFDNAGGDADVLGVRAVIEEQIFAEILKASFAEEAGEAGRGVGRDDAFPDGKAVYVFTDGDDVAGKLVAEDSRRDNHAGMISTAKDFDVGAAGQSNFHPNENVSAFDCRNVYRFYLQVFLAVKNGRHHAVVHYDHLCG